MARSANMKLSIIAAMALCPGSPTQAWTFPSNPHYVNNIKSTSTPGTTTSSIPPAVAVTAALTAALALNPSPSVAVSGGGLDYAGTTISNQDFSNNSKSYKGKDFTQVIAQATNFANSNLQGCRFYKAFLVDTNFEAADLRGASLEDTSMDNANLKNALLNGAYFSASLFDIKSAEGADFTDASIPPKTLARLCDREDVKGTNPVTGVDTRDSLMCL